jgi:hypothetical protein
LRKKCRQAIFHTLQSVKVLETVGSKGSRNSRASHAGQLIGLRRQGGQGPANCMVMFHGCASANAIHPYKAARSEFSKMARQWQGGYLDGRLNLHLGFPTAIQAAKEANAQRMGESGGKFDDLCGRYRFLAQGDF